MSEDFDDIHPEALKPEALKKARKRQNMTQQQLAKKLKCSKDTVSRWERGTVRRVRSRLREPLANALRTTWASLCKPPDRSSDNPQDLLGRTRVKVSIEKRVQAALRLVAARYDIRPGDVLEVAPLLFLIVAERSLLERKRRLEEIHTALHDAEEKLGKNRAHLNMVTTDIMHEAEEMLEQEEESLGKRDVFGRSINYENWFSGDAGPFVHFVRDLANPLPQGAVTSIESFEGDMIGPYEIAEDTLRECTGISENDEQGEEILHYIRWGDIDLTECVRMKRNSDEASYREWLSKEWERLKEEAVREFSQELERLERSSSKSTETATPEERSEP